MLTMGSLITSVASPIGQVGKPRPLVVWMPPDEPQDGPSPRAMGFIAGLVVATMFVLLALDRPGGVVGSLGTYGVATLVAGSVGGWIFGPMAWNARTDGAWILPIAGLSVTAVVLGASVVGLQLGLVLASDAAGPGEAVNAVLGMILFTAVFGSLTLGLFMLPMTFAASAVWALVMVIVRSRTLSEPSRSRNPMI